MKLEFAKSPKGPAWDKTSAEDWQSPVWQARNTLKSLSDFESAFDLTESERAGFEQNQNQFKIRCTPYYASLAAAGGENDPIRKILMPTSQEFKPGRQSMEDPLGEAANSKSSRLIHRYSDRVLFLVTDICDVYCRYCTRKRFTGKDQSKVRGDDYDQALSYIKSQTGIREVILSGGDPLTLSDTVLDKILTDIRSIEHVEIIRIGSRIPTVNPFRINQDLISVLKKHKPVYLMSHFNHPRELTAESAQALELLVDNGIPVFNQMVLLNGVNNHAAIVQALSRRLLFLRVKPYYMLQCDPSMGTDHLRTSLEESENIQRELWGHLSGLAMPNLIVDLPNGGGKVGVVPDFVTEYKADRNVYSGWDGVNAEYINPDPKNRELPSDLNAYLGEFQMMKDSKSEGLRPSSVHSFKRSPI